MEEGMLNRVSAVVRAYDPCLSCSTHASATFSLASGARFDDQPTCNHGAAESVAVMRSRVQVTEKFGGSVCESNAPLTSQDANRRF